MGSIAGRRLACLSAEAQMTDHAWGFAPGESDFHDMRLLTARLGTALPAGLHTPLIAVPRAGAHAAAEIRDFCPSRGHGKVIQPFTTSSVAATPFSAPVSAPVAARSYPRKDSSVEAPETRYAKTADGVYIAYQTIGNGPMDLVLVCYLLHIEHIWTWPVAASFSAAARHVLAPDPLRSKGTGCPTI